jgi:hypothetical protein
MAAAAAAAEAADIEHAAYSNLGAHLRCLDVRDNDVADAPNGAQARRCARMSRDMRCSMAAVEQSSRAACAGQPTGSHRVAEQRASG